MKLVSVTFKVLPRLPGVSPGNLVQIDMEKKGPLDGWRILVRGQQVWLVSPPGWTKDASARRAVGDNTTVVFEIPRADVCFQWQAESADDVAEVLKGGKYESPPIGQPKIPDAPEKAAPVPANQMGDV